MNGGMGWSWQADETVKEEEVRDRMEVDGERKERRPLGPPCSGCLPAEMGETIDRMKVPAKYPLSTRVR